MAVGEARALHGRDPDRLIAIGAGKRVRWDAQVFAHNPYLADQTAVGVIHRAGGDVIWLDNYPGSHRAYCEVWLCDEQHRY